jgi:hypothetical protein
MPKPRFEYTVLDDAWKRLASGEPAVDVAASLGTTKRSLYASMDRVGLSAREALKEYTRRLHVEALVEVLDGRPIAHVARERHLAKNRLSELRLEVTGSSARAIFTGSALRRAWQAILEGSSVAEQAALLGVHPSSLKQAMARQGFSVQEAQRSRTALKLDHAKGLIAGGMLLQEAAVAVGLSRCYLSRRIGLDLRKNGPSLVRRSAPVDILRRAYTLHLSGLSDVEVAARMGICRTQVIVYWKRYRRLLDSEGLSRYPVDEHE